MKILYLENREIDQKKWNKCIEKAFNGSIYGFTWFLNTTCVDWDALVLNDYEAVMPLPLEIRFKSQIISCPTFVNQLGIFSKVVLDQNLTAQFIDAIPKKFKVVRLAFNKFNKIDGDSNNFTTKNTLELDLIQPYSKIYSKYFDEVCKKLTQAEKEKFYALKSLTPENFISFYQNNNKSPNVKFGSRQLGVLRMLISNAIRYQQGEVIAAYDKCNQLVAASFILWSHNKIHLIASVVTLQHNDDLAAHCIIDHLIKLNAEKILTLHFDEASNPYFSSIYQGFGASSYEYLMLEKAKGGLFKLLR